MGWRELGIRPLHTIHIRGVFIWVLDEWTWGCRYWEGDIYVIVLAEIPESVR